MIGVGLPQLGPETELLRARFEESYGDGYAYAYLYPGLCRVLQAGGRLIRSPTDRGALLLMDDRYARDPYPSCCRPTGSCAAWAAWRSFKGPFKPSGPRHERPDA